MTRYPTPPYDGACLCGAIKVHVTLPPLLTLACHCRDCQHLSASAFTLTTMFPAAGVTIMGDVVRGGLHAEGRCHYLCASCLTIIYSRIKGADHRINLRTSVLRDAAQFAPFVEVMAEEKMPWVTIPVAHRFARMPPSLDALQGLMDDYARQRR